METISQVATALSLSQGLSPHLSKPAEKVDPEGSLPAENPDEMDSGVDNDGVLMMVTKVHQPVFYLPDKNCE